VSYLLDTNVVTEPRRRNPDPRLLAWIRGSQHDAAFISVLVMGELRQGVERMRRKDPRQAEVQAKWLEEIRNRYADRIVPVDAKVADVWGRISVPDPISRVDGLMAATALAYDWTFVTRNTKHVERTGVRLLNPFEAGGSANPT
jgi:predicted nucleic acid-binding protein